MNDTQGLPGGNTIEPAPADVAAGHEVSDVSIRGLVVFLAGLVVSLVVVGTAVAWMLELLADQAERNDPKPPALAELRDKEPPGPRLQHSPATEMDQIRREQEAKLSQTKWIDKQEKLVQVPIEQAMRRVAENGLPAWPPVKDEKKQESDQTTDAKNSPPAEEQK